MASKKFPSCGCCDDTALLFASRRLTRSAAVFFTALVFTLGVTNIAAQGLPSGKQVQGDFNGDGILDALFQPATTIGTAQIILGDATSQLTIPGQSIPAAYLGLSWSQDQSNIVIGDFTGNGRSDILVQPLESGGVTALLLAEPNGQFSSIAQQFTGAYMGLDWSATSHKLVVGDFTGNGRDDVLLQAATPGGMNLIAEPNTQGIFNTTGQSWPDGYLGLQWSSQNVTLYTGDFTGNGQSDLLVQVNDPASDTQVPAYALLLAAANGEFTQINQSWSVSAFGADWSPLTHMLSIQDVTGAGVDDIVLMAKDPNGTNYLFLGNQTGTFSKPDLTWTGNESAKTAWANHLANSESISVTGNTVQTAQPQTTSATRIHSQTVGADSLQTPTTVGDMGGQSGVNGGAATYSIPIVVPPGRAGMQPSLSLSYSSRGGNGDVGMGWSLSGLSAITRCPATKAQDGYTQGVTYSATYDRLCLDGQHLIGVSGTYGQTGSVYRTELDSYVRVTLTGSGSNINAQSDFFEVDYEDGRKAYYGYNPATGADTQFLASGVSAPLVWAIAEEVDASGNNSVAYNYASYGEGEYHVASIVYSGTANREVDFTYTARPDPSSVWLAGGLTRQTQILNAITTKVSGNEVRQWALNYSSSAATGRSLLTSAQECGYAPGSSSLSCLSPDTFTWQDAALSFSAPTAVNLPSTINTGSGIDCTYSCTAALQFYIYGAGDYDGDGVNERFYENPVTGTSAVFWVNGPTGTNLINFSSTFATQYTGLQQDFLSNGYADAIGDNSNHNVLIASCTAPPACTNVSDFTLTPTGISDANSILITGQFAGDGLNDVLVVGNTPSTWNYNFTYYPNKTKGGDTVPSFTTPGVSLGTYAAGVPSSTSVIGDLDGNGIPDVLVSSGGIPTAVAFFSNTSGSPGATSMTIKSVASLGIQDYCGLNGGSPGYCTFADINGDGLPDWIYVADDSGTGATPTWHYQLNEGGHFGPAVNTGVAVPTVILNTPGYFNNFNAFRTGDFTNDGKDEILVPVARVSTYCLNLKVKLEDVYQPETICGDDLYGNAPLGGNYTGDDFSVFQFQILKFVEQANGTYVPTWVTNGSSPVTLNSEAGMMEVGDVNGSGLTGIAMLSSKWYDDGVFNKPDSEWPADGCPVGHTNAPPCASWLGTGYYTITPQGGAPDLMTGATNGLGAQAAWQYDSLTDLKSQGIYTVDQPCSTSNPAGQPVEYYCFTSSMWVIKSYSVSNDTGTTNSYTYAYNDAVYENRGRGFQGFRQIAITDQTAGTIATNTYNQAFPLSGTLTESKVTTTSGTVLSDTTNIWNAASPVSCLAASNVYWPELTQSTVVKNGTSGENISTTTTNYFYDGYGNTTQVAASTVDSTGTYGTTTNYLNNSPDCTNWWLDKFGKKTVAVSASYASPIISQPGTITRSANYSYTPLPLRKILTEQDDSADTPSGNYEKDTAYTYDSYGNTTSVAVSSPVTGISGIASRTVSTDYSGTSGYFADAITNAAGQATQINPDPDTGQPLTVTDPNGVVTSYDYDAFGRKTLEQVTAPISLPAININYNSPDRLCAATAFTTAYEVTTSQAGSPGKSVCYDLLNHVLRTATDGFASGDPSVVDTQYDSLGRMTQTSEPHNNEHTTVYWNKVNQYDVLNRVLNKTDAEGVNTTYSYSGLTATAVTTPPDSPAFTTVTTTNSLGKLLSTVDAKGSDTEFRYDSQGNPILIQDTADHQTLATYNTLGQKSSITDPDMGHWTYVYDVLGNLKQQTDAKNQVIAQTFDLLNRMTSRTQPEGTTTWTYDTCTNGVGKLCNVTQYSGYQQTYTYDGVGRVSNVHEVINGNPYDTSTSYDSDGRVSSVAYPAGVSDSPPTANAGSNQTVLVDATVQLDGSGSGTGGFGKPLVYQWTQTAGPAQMSLSGATTLTPNFTATTAGNFTFQLAVSDGLIAATSSVNVTVRPQAPSTLSINESTSTNGSYIVSWGTATGATSYQLLESTNGGSTYAPPVAASSPDNLSGKGSLTSNITYTYEVEGCGNSVCGPPSNSASVLVTLPPTAPSSISLPSQSNWDSSFTVSYGTATGVLPTYQVEVGNYTTNHLGQQVFVSDYSCSSTGTSCTFTAGQVALGTYYAQVYACNQSACGPATPSDNAITVWKLTPPGASSLSAPSMVTSDSISLSWSAPSTATSYNLYASYEKNNSFGSYTERYSGSATSYTDSFGALVQAVHYYVVACNQAGCGPDSNVTLTIVQLQGPCKTCAPTNPPPSTAAPPAGSASPPGSTGFGAADSTQLAPPVPAASPVTPASTLSIATTRVDMNVPTARPVTIAPSAVPQIALVTVSVPSLHSVGESGSEGEITSSASRLLSHAVQRSTTTARGAMPEATASPSSWHYGLPEYLADADLHLATVSSPTEQVGLTVQYAYTSTGYLQQLSNAIYPSQVFWAANTADAFGQIESETYGGGVISSSVAHSDPLGRITGISSTGSSTLQGWSYSWNALGNLSSRANSADGNASEQFQYDLLNRLLQAQVTNGSGVQPALSYGYDAIGDITSKSDMGSYSYSGTGPHAVSSISGSNPGTYHYDADGNMTNRNGTAITWNSDNLPTCIDAGGGTCTGGSNWSQFSYAPDKHRYYQSAQINGASETTVYAGAFEAVTTGGATTYRYHLSADSREVAEVDLSNSGSSVVEKVSYVLTDHLGSTDVVETTDVNNNVLSTQYMSFSAWGGRREPNTWLPPVGATETQTDHQADRYGFTHQEMLDNVGIIHMNGRIYDPNLGRFLSVDPVFEFPTNTQSLNPYSYVLNNPLSMTDPTGYVESCGTGKTSCPASVSVSITKETTAHDIDSRIATHGMTTITTTKEANGNTVQTASGNGFGLGETAEVSARASGGGNGAQNTQSAASAQQQPTTHTDIGSPSQIQMNAATNTNTTGSTQMAMVGGSANSDTQQRTVPPCAEGNCMEPSKDTDKIPYRLVIDRSRTEVHRSFSIFHYKLLNVRGQTLTGSGYLLEEWLWNDKAHTQPNTTIGTNSENQFVHMADGEFLDYVGYAHPALGQRSFSAYQTFTIEYGGKPYYPATEFLHQTIVAGESYTNIVTDIKP